MLNGKIIRDGSLLVVILTIIHELDFICYAAVRSLK